MTVDYSRDLMIGMLRKGQTGDQILQILDAIVPYQTQMLNGGNSWERAYRDAFSPETDNNTVSADVINA